MSVRGSTNYYSVGREFYDDDYSDKDDSSVCGQLDFSHPLVTLREDSLKSLSTAYRSLSPDGYGADKYKKAVCWVHGLSGTGKSTLFQQFIDSLPEKPLVLRGKYEERKGGQDAHPLSALLDAFAGLGSANVITEEEQLALRQTILRNLGHEGISSISTVIPKLGKLLAEQKGDGTNHSSQANLQGSSTQLCPSQESLGNLSRELSNNSQSSQYTSSTTTFSTRRNTEMAVNRLKYMFQAVTSAISNLRPEQPTILHLDDIQWTDKGTLEVLEVLLMDQEITNFMFVGCCRSDAVTQDLLETMETIHNAAENSSILVKNLEVRNLSTEGVTNYLKGVFHIDTGDEPDSEDAERVQEFATVLHNKAAGNIFFMQQILAELNTKGSLTFSHITFRWEWDLDQIPVADTVLQAVTDRIKSNSSPMQVALLKTAAYMRHSFDVNSLLEVMKMDESEACKKLTREIVKKELDKAVAKELLSNAAGASVSESVRDVYCFAHDRIQQAVYELVAEGPTRRKFCQSIGSRLYKLWAQDNEHDFPTKDWMLFAAVDHYNAAMSADDKDNGENIDYFLLATINFKAGEKCVEVAAFDNASKYLGVALKCLEALPEPAWSAHYDFTLDVHVTATDVELTKGNMAQGRTLVEMVAKNARALEDRLPTQLALAKAFGRTKRHQEAFAMARQALQEAGIYGKTALGIKLALGRDLIYVRRYFRTHSDDDILSLPVLDDKHLTTMMELIRTTSYFAYWCGNTTEFLAAALKSIRMTLREGLLPPSGTSFMAYFMYADHLGDKNAQRFANLGLEILARTDQSKFCLQYLIKTTTDAWSTDITRVKAQYDESYRRGLAVGDFQNAMLALDAGVTHLYTAGYHLAMIDLQYADNLRKEELYHLDSVKDVTRANWTAVRHLRGTAGAPLDIAALLPAIQNEEFVVLKPFLASYLQLAVYFGDYDVMDSIFDMDRHVNNSHAYIGIPLCFTAIACAVLHQRTGQRGYIQKGKACVAQLKEFSLARGMNSWHRYSIARAHLKACTKWRRSNPLAALEDYEKSIKLALERDHKQDVGLAAQLAAEYLLWADGEIYADYIRKYMKLAIQSYRDWGASNLVRHLEGKYSTVLGDKATAATAEQEYPLE